MQGLNIAVRRVVTSDRNRGAKKPRVRIIEGRKAEMMVNESIFVEMLPQSRIVRRGGDG